MKKIAILYDRELSIGGVETHILTLLKHINRRDFSYTLISPVSEGFEKKALALGAQVTPIPNFKPLNIRVLSSIAALLRKGEIDLTHIHSPAAAISGRLASVAAGLPIVVTVHAPSVAYYGDRQTIRARTGRSIYINLDRLLNYTATRRLVYVSNRVYEDCISRRISPSDRSVVIHNGIDLEPYRITDRDASNLRIRSELNVAPGTPVITYTGRLAEEKGLDVLIEAINILFHQGQTNFAVWLIGAGASEAELVNKVKSYGLADQVTFLGYQEQVTKYLLASDCFVMPSRHEAMSIALMEAMAAGLPCVVSDVGDNARLVEDGQGGLVVPTNSPAQLAIALERLLAEPQLREKMGANAKQKAATFSSAEMVRQLEIVYHQALGL
jgi:glycosyltransferase involved in cell wall biosynthesis